MKEAIKRIKNGENIDYVTSEFVLRKTKAIAGAMAKVAKKIEKRQAQKARKTKDLDKKWDHLNKANVARKAAKKIEELPEQHVVLGLLTDIIKNKSNSLVSKNESQDDGVIQYYEVRSADGTLICTVSKAYSNIPGDKDIYYDLIMGSVSVPRPNLDQATLKELFKLANKRSAKESIEKVRAAKQAKQEQKKDKMIAFLSRFTSLGEEM